MRRAGSRFRITAQLIEAATGAHLWLERYYRSLDDIFAVQDEVARMIVSKLHGRMEDAELQQALRKPTVSPAAHYFLLRGTVHLRGYEPEDNIQALHLFDRAAKSTRVMAVRIRVAVWRQPSFTATPPAGTASTEGLHAALRWP